MQQHKTNLRVGELRPSQLLYTFGVGAIVDLPYISAMVMGLEDWNTEHMEPIVEERLLAAVKSQLGYQVERLCSPPRPLDNSPDFVNPFEESWRIGVPVAPFPRWLRCTFCSLLAPLSSGLFELKSDVYRPELTRYVHGNCRKPGKEPIAVPARFLVACARGHLDDFPWTGFVHRGTPCSSPKLELREFGVSGSATDVLVKCINCNAKRSMSDAFGTSAQTSLPRCTGRRPHLRNYLENGCAEQMKTILLGASNIWFPVNLSVLSIPSSSNKLAQLVDEHWAVLEKATSLAILSAFRSIGQLRPFANYSDEEIWRVLSARREGSNQAEEFEVKNLKMKEWHAFTAVDAVDGSDFRLTQLAPPHEFNGILEKVVLVERLREVRALIGFTRIQSPGDFSEVGEMPMEQRAPLSRQQPQWVPAAEVRGEGLFFQFNESALARWQKETSTLMREREFIDAHQQWCAVRSLDSGAYHFPGLRYVLLHTFAHTLMRQLAIECGYTAASIRERIYSRHPNDPEGPMAGVLIYTAAPDSEGTLGGLVSLGEPSILARHIGQALEQAKLCTSDPLCAEHQPANEGVSLHGAACHACLFAPETSCERGNRYLDRSVLVQTIAGRTEPFWR